jgi:hypothetical protein
MRDTPDRSLQKVKKADLTLTCSKELIVGVSGVEARTVFDAHFQIEVGVSSLCPVREVHHVKPCLASRALVKSGIFIEFAVLTSRHH